MKHPTLSDLPTPPGNKIGWPWTEGIQQLLDNMDNGDPWPRITVVTPSFNQAQFIEETIRSVLLQGYPNTEYIIIDGGSTDNSVDIIKKYEPWITYWVSEPDRGQSHAINKGLFQCTGKIMAWINSDDFYCPGTFKQVAEFFTKEDFGWVAGKCVFLDVDGTPYEYGSPPPTTLPRWLVKNRVLQPAVFWKAGLWKPEHPLDEDMHYSFDYEFWLRFLSRGYAPGWIDRPLAFFRYHSQSKTVKHIAEFKKENGIIFTLYYSILKRNEKIQVKLLRNLNMIRLTIIKWLLMEDTTNCPFIRALQAFRNSQWYEALRYYYRKKRHLRRPMA